MMISPRDGSRDGSESSSESRASGNVSVWFSSLSSSPAKGSLLKFFLAKYADVMYASMYSTGVKFPGVPVTFQIQIKSDFELRAAAYGRVCVDG